MIGAGKKELDVNVQDQSTEPINDYFLQAISNFTISADTGESGIEANQLIFEFEAVVGHLLTAGKEIILLDTASNRSLYAVVKVVTVNTIQIDRPIDHDFKASSTLGRIVNSNMNVLGSIADPQIYSIRAGSVPQDFTGFKITMSDNAVMTDDLFGSRAELPNGMVFRIVNSFQKTIFTFKKNSDFAQYGELIYPEKVPSGIYALNATFNFLSLNERGVVLRIATDDVLQIVITDDYRTINSVKVSGIGHKTKGEE